MTAVSSPKCGTWFSYGDERLGQGRENARIFLRDNYEVRTRLETEVRQALNMQVAEVPEHEEAEAELA